MRIQHNIAALNSYRNLTNNNSAVAKNLEKLSSGYRINRAGDDAAGLAISEKMRAQITGLETAQKNAQDGISLVQTAEGALTEVHSMLNRMVELADQSANGTYDNEVDRTNLQKEIDSLKSEIDRISKATNFNGIKLLDGSIGEAKGLSTGMTDAVEGTALKNAFTTTTDGVDGKLTPGKAAVAAKDEFYMPDTLQVSHDETNAGANAGTLSFDLTADNGKKVTVKLTSNTTAAGETSTFTMDEIVDALKNNTANTDVDLGDGRKITLTVNDAADLTDIRDNYEFSFKDNKLVSTAKNAGADYSMELDNVVATGGAAGDGTEDIKAMTESLKNDLDEDTTGTPIDLGAKTSASVAGKDPVKGSYTVGSIKVTLDDEDNLHGSALKVGDKTYILQKEGQNLDEALAELADNDSNIEIVKFADGEAMSELMNAINANKDETNLQAVANGTDIQISETEAYGNKILASAEGAAPIDMSEAVGSATLTIGAEEASKNVSVSADLTEGSQVTIGKKTYQFLTKPEDAVDGKIGIQFTEGNAQANAQALLDAIKANDSSLADTAKLDADGPSVILGSNTVAADASSKGLTLQVGDTSDSYQKVSVVVKSTSTASLGIDGIDISTQEGASAAIDKIKDAINSVSSTRGDLGAIQNRLEHTINNLGVTTENITAAESRIRDVDMAKEMMAYTKNNILVQASQAMLAQANQVPQGVLQLLG